jgi:hypothetical protein
MMLTRDTVSSEYHAQGKEVKSHSKSYDGLIEKPVDCHHDERLAPFVDQLREAMVQQNAHDGLFGHHVPDGAVPAGSVHPQKDWTRSEGGLKRASQPSAAL